VNREETLAFAHELLKWNIPVIVCKPQIDGDQMIPVRAWRNITNAAQCDLSDYVHGEDALALVGGHGIDLIDVDSKSDGSIAPFDGIQFFGITGTPSGGRHYVVPSTGLRKIQDLSVDGVFVGDYVGGNNEHEGRLIAYLPGSHRPNKYPGIQYTVIEPWDIEGAVMSEPDTRMLEILETAGARLDGADVFIDDSPMRDPVDGRDPEAQKWIEEELARLDDLPQPWAPGSYWDDTTFSVACALLRIANSNWSGYSEEDALLDLLDHAPSDDAWGARQHREKWRSAREAVGPAGRMNPRDPRNDFTPEEVEAARKKPGIDVTKVADALDFVFRIIGREGTALAGLFRRGQDLVYTPRVGESGYEMPEGREDDDGTLKIKRMTVMSFCTYMDKRYNVYKMNRRAGVVPALFPTEVGARAISAPELLDSLRSLVSVTHTPVVRADGTVLVRPGFDDDSGMLYLPDRGLRVPSESKGLPLLLEMTEGFDFVSDHDRVNYFAALLTPLMRQMIPPPYPLVAVGAPQPGSGKSLLTSLIRILHGGVFRSEVVRDQNELRKQITSILDTTAAPVITFDNLNGVFRSSTFDGLLTSATWTDRVLGSSSDLTVPNDRLWTITGNNLSLGGDLKRRTVWVTIDPKMEHPETRTGFKHEALEQWVEENRGEILAALLGLVTDWVDAGMPDEKAERTDSFGKWQQIMSGILSHAGLPGVLNHADSIRQSGLEDEDEWAVFLRAIRDRFGANRWQIKAVMQAISMGEIDAGVLPDDVLAKMRLNESAAAKSLGRWVQNRMNRWYDGLAVTESGLDRNRVKYWVVLTHDETLL
jgi:hypothetical protein